MGLKYMSRVFSDLFGKATDDIENCTLVIHKKTQHDNAGGHLSKGAEKLFKAYLELCGIDSYPQNGKHGHDLSVLLKMLQQTDFPYDDFKNLVRLQIYDSPSGYGYIPEERKLDLKVFLDLANELQRVVLKKYRAKGRGSAK
jgi:hypothetical protein